MSRLGSVYSQSVILDTSVTRSVGLTQTAQGANNIVCDDSDIFMRSLYGYISFDIELKQY